MVLSQFKVCSPVVYKYVCKYIKLLSVRLPNAIYHRSSRTLVIDLSLVNLIENVVGWFVCLSC